MKFNRSRAKDSGDRRGMERAALGVSFSPRVRPKDLALENARFTALDPRRIVGSGTVPIEDFMSEFWYSKNFFLGSDI